MKKLAILLPLFLLNTLAACSGSTLVDSAETGTLEVKFTHHDQNRQAILADAEGFKSFTTDQGYQVTLKEAVVNWNQLDLLRQGEQGCESSPSASLKVDRSEDFLGLDLQSLLLADGDIPLEEYCRYRLILAPTGYVASAKLHEGHGEGNAPVAVSFHLIGTWQKNGGSGTFDLMSVEPLMVEAAFRSKENGVELEHPLHFHDGESEIVLVFSTSYDRLFSGIDFANETTAAQISRVRGNFVSSVAQSYEGHAE